MPQDFNGFGLPTKLHHALVRMNFMTPTPVQAQTIPLALEGRDVLGSAQTGTGKTGAFGIPVIAGLMNRPDAAALIMTPTRELAGQVMAALQQMIPVADIKTALADRRRSDAAPVAPIAAQSAPDRRHAGPHQRPSGTRQRRSCNNVRFLVLDETDRMLDMGFGIQIERILRHVPCERQTLMFSATLPHEHRQAVGQIHEQPRTHRGRFDHFPRGEDQTGSDPHQRCRKIRQAARTT